MNAPSCERLCFGQVGEWGACSATCGEGNATRPVTCDVRGACQGDPPLGTEPCVAFDTCAYVPRR